MILVTGFPGFLASELMMRLLKKNASEHFACLVQPKFKKLAEGSVANLTKDFPNAKNQIELVEGDITQSDLGISDASLAPKISRIFHFAAVYDLSVQEAFAIKVNVEGTRHVLDYAKKCTQLKRMDYVSTCYVSGRFEGLFHEKDLEKGQTFNNFYESTKYEAERLVRAEMAKGMPVAIYRPAVVVGNSRTGLTQKFDGPYFIMQWLLRQPKTAILPRLPHPERYTINVVPSDYVIDAMAYLVDQPSSIGKTFQLADPKPLTVKQMVECLGKACDRNVITVTLPKGLAKISLKALPPVEKWLGIPASALDYFDHPTNYDVSDTLEALKNSGIACPQFPTYADTLVTFMKSSPHLRTKALV